jgi:hypothetical protein
MEMSPVIVLKIFTPSWRFSTTFLDFSKFDNFKNKPAGVLKIFYDQMPTLPSSDDITRFDGSYDKVVMCNPFLR